MGSMFKSPKAPQPMNVGAVTQQANQQNISNAYTNKAFNQQNQTDQFGNQLNYQQNGVDSNGNPLFNVEQKLGATGQQFAGGLAGLGQQYMSQAGEGAPDSQGAFDKAYGYATANLEPRFERATNAMENKLRNQGLDPTSEAYKSQMSDVGLQQNEARNNLVSSLQGQMFQQGLAGRQQQMSELQPGMQFGMGSISPNLVNTPQVGVQNVDVAGLNAQNYQQQMDAYKAKMAQQGAFLGGLGGIGGTLAQPILKSYFA